MPLLEIRHVAPRVRLALWHATETPAQMLALYPHLQQFPPAYSCEARQMEYLSSRALLYEMTANSSLLIDHLPSGQPFLKTSAGQVLPYHISISHTRGYVVLLLSENEPVGIDIERVSDRVERIAKRFIRPDEAAPTVGEMLRIWSAKETIYKLFSADNLQYFDMQTLSSHPSQMVLENKKHGRQVTVFVEQTADYVLTWAIGNGSSPLPSTS